MCKMLSAAPSTSSRRTLPAPRCPACPARSPCGFYTTALQGSRRRRVRPPPPSMMMLYTAAIILRGATACLRQWPASVHTVASGAEELMRLRWRAGVRGSFQPVSLNTYSSWGMQPGVDNSAVPARRISGAHATSGGGTPHAAMQHADVYTSAGQPPQTSGGHGDMFSASVPKESDVGSARGAVRMDGPPRWQHSGGSAGPGGGGAAAPVDGRYAARQGAGMPQQVPVGGGYGGPQVIYGVPAQANNSFNAMYIGMQPAYLDHNGGVAGGPQGMSIFPQEQMLQVRGGPMAAPQAMPGAHGHAVHEGTQRGGTALRRLQNVPEGSTRPVMLRAAPTGRTAPRRSGVVLQWLPLRRCSACCGHPRMELATPCLSHPLLLSSSPGGSCSARLCSLQVRAKCRMRDAYCL